MRVFGEGLFERFTRDSFLGIQEEFSTTTFRKSVIQMSEQKAREDEFDFGIQYHQTLISSLITKLNQRVERLNNIYSGLLEGIAHQRVPADNTYTVVDGMQTVPKPQLTTYVREGHTILDQELYSNNTQWVQFHGYNPYFGSYAVNDHDDTLVRLNYLDQKTPVPVPIVDYGARVGQPAQPENYAGAGGFPGVPAESWIWRNDGNHAAAMNPTYFNYSFKLDSYPPAPAVVTVAVDDVADIYLNGQQINPAQIRWDTGVATFNVDPSFFRLGDNMVVIKWQRVGGGGGPDAINFHMQMPDGTAVSTGPVPEGYIDYDGNGSFTPNEEIVSTDPGYAPAPGELWYDNGSGGGYWYKDWNGNGLYDSTNAELDPTKDYNMNGSYDAVDPYNPDDFAWFWTEQDILTNPPMKNATIASPPAYQENGAFWTTIDYLWKWDLDRINAGYRSGTVDVNDPNEKVMINTTVLQPNRPIKPTLKVGDRIALPEEITGIRPGGVTYDSVQGYVFQDQTLEAIVTSVRTNPDGTTVPDGWKIVYEGQGNADPNDTTGVPMIGTGTPQEISKATISESFDLNNQNGWQTYAVNGGPAGWYQADNGAPGVWPVSPNSADPDSGVFFKNLTFNNAVPPIPDGTAILGHAQEQGQATINFNINNSAEVRLFGDTVPTVSAGAPANVVASVQWPGNPSGRVEVFGSSAAVNATLNFPSSELTVDNNLVEIFAEDTADGISNFLLNSLQMEARFITAKTGGPTPRYTIDAYGNIWDKFGDGYQEDPNGVFYVNTSQQSNAPNNTYTTAVGDNSDTVDDHNLWDYVPDLNNPLLVGSFSSNFFYYKDTMDDTSRYTQFIGERPANIDDDLPNPNTAIMPHLEFDGREENRFGDLNSSNRVVVGNPTAPAFGQVVLGYVEQDQSLYNQVLLDKEFKSVAFWKDIQDGVDLVGRNSEVGQVTAGGGEQFRVNDALIELHLSNKSFVYDPGGIPREVPGPAKKITKIEVVVEGDQPIPENDIQRYSTDWQNTDADGVLGNTNLGDDWAIEVHDVNGNQVQGTIQGGGLNVTDGMKLSLYLDRSMAMSSNAPVQVKVYYDDGSTETIGKAGLSNDGGAPNPNYQPDYYNYLVVGEGRSGGSYDNPVTQELKKWTEDPEFLKIMKYGLLDDVYITASSLDPYNDMVFGKLALSWEEDKRRIKVRQLSYMASWHS